jgi:hypothetical protein
MKTRNHGLAALALALAIAGTASPSFAQQSRNHSDQARDAAVQECSVKASKWSNTMWQTQQFAAYSNCMTEHGQQP